MTSSTASIEGMGKEVFNVLRREGPLDLTQIIVETLIPEDQIISVMDHLLSKRCVEERPDKGQISYNEYPLLRVYGLPTFHPSRVGDYFRRVLRN